LLAAIGIHKLEFGTIWASQAATARDAVIGAKRARVGARKPGSCATGVDDLDGERRILSKGRPGGSLRELIRRLPPQQDTVMASRNGLESQ